MDSAGRAPFASSMISKRCRATSAPTSTCSPASIPRLSSSGTAPQVAATTPSPAAFGDGPTHNDWCYCSVRRLTAPVSVSVPIDRYSSRSVIEMLNATRRSSRAASARDQAAIHRVELEFVGPVDLLAGELLQELIRVLVRVDDDARAGLGGLVEPRRVGRADVDPGRDPPGQVANRDRGIVRVRHAARELDPVRVLQQIGEQPRDEILLRLRRVARDPQLSDS